MANLNPNATAEMTENESIASMITTVLGGRTGAPYDQLRAVRQAITALGKELRNEFKELENDEDGIENFGCDFDEKRRRYWRSIVDYVDLAREKHDLKLISDENLRGVATSVDNMANTWNKTRYFHTVHGYAANPLPSREDVFKPLPKTGSKRQVNNFSINTDVNVNSPAGQRIRSSSPYHEGVVPGNINVSEVVPEQVAGALLDVPSAAPPTPQVTAPTPPVQNLVDVHTPLSVSNVARWAGQAGGNEDSPAYRPPAMGPLQLNRQARQETQRVKKENEELKLKLAAVEEKAKAEIETAVKKREQELYDEGNKKFAEEKAKLLQGATAIAPDASERAAAEFQRISAAAQEATEKARREQQKREEMEKEYNARLADFQRQLNQREQEMVQQLNQKQETLNAMVEAKRQADAVVAETQRQLYAVKTQKKADNFLPSSTPANDPTTLNRFSKKKSPPRAQKEHQLNQDLNHRQLHSPAATAGLPGHLLQAPQSVGSGVNTVNNSASDFIRRMDNADYENMDWSGVAPDTWLRIRQMDVDAMRAARPAKPFSSGSPMDYALHIANFERVTNKATASSRDKLEELTYWFAGDAKDIIASYVTGKNPDENLAFAKSELDRLYKGSKDTFASVIQSILKGDPVKQNDYNGHIKLYASLKNAIALSNVVGPQGQFMDSKTVINIVTARLPHMADRFLLHAEQLKSISQRGVNFDDLKKHMDSWIWVLQQKFPDGQQEQKKANVAAVSSAPQQRNGQKQTFSQRLVDSPPKQQHKIAPTCTYCGARHACHDCSELKKMPVKQRVIAIQSKNLCFHCMTSGCRARSCKDRPTCGICGKGHATLLHDNDFVQKKNKPSTLSPEAIDFRPYTAPADAAAQAAAATPSTTSVNQNAIL